MCSQFQTVAARRFETSDLPVHVASQQIGEDPEIYQDLIRDLAKTQVWLGLAEIRTHDLHFY